MEHPAVSLHVTGAVRDDNNPESLDSTGVKFCEYAVLVWELGGHQQFQ
jgi:hypothetical protein